MSSTGPNSQWLLLISRQDVLGSELITQETTHGCGQVPTHPDPVPVREHLRDPHMSVNISPPLLEGEPRLVKRNKSELGFFSPGRKSIVDHYLFP